MRKLLEEGADPNYGGKCAHAPLETVCSAFCSENNVECAKLLLEFGADPNLNSTLVTACRGGKYDFVKLLIDSGAIVRYGQMNELLSLAIDAFYTLHLDPLVHTPGPARERGLESKKVLDLLLLKREEMEKGLHDSVMLPLDVIKEIHSFL